MDLEVPDQVHLLDGKFYLWNKNSAYLKGDIVLYSEAEDLGYLKAMQNINKDNNPTTWPHRVEIVNGNPNPNYFWSTVN